MDVPTGAPPGRSPSPEGFGDLFPLDADWLPPDDGVDLPPVIGMEPMTWEPAADTPEEAAYRDDLTQFVARGITQDRLGFPWGNCTEAAWATILGVTLDDLPDIRAWAEDRGANAMEVDRAIQIRNGLLQQWVFEHLGVLGIYGRGDTPPGLKAKLYREQQLGYPLAPLYWVASGPGPRGHNHAVVYADDRLVWDPHPHRTGLERVTAWTLFVPLGSGEAVSW